MISEPERLSDLERLARAINDEPDHLHGDRTPAVHALIEHGLDALPYVLPLLEDADQWTRLRAQRVLEGVTRSWTEKRLPSRPLARSGLRAWERLWLENGGYDWEAAPAERARSVARWRSWMEDLDTK